MKKFFLATALAFGALSTQAQEQGGIKLGIGPMVSLPIGDFGDATSFGVGGEAQFSYGITDNIAAFAQAGFNYFKGKEIDLPFGGSIDGPNASLIPMLAGARYHNSGFMIGAAIGYGKFVGDYEGGGFMYSPQIGYSFSNIDVIAHYSAVSNDGTASFVGLKLFYNFLSSDN